MEIRKVLDDYCETSTLWEVFEEMAEIMGESNLLESLALAMNTDELQENLKYIARQWDL